MLARRFKDALVTNHRFELMTFDLFFVFKDGSTDPDALNRHSSLRFLPDTLAARVPSVHAGSIPAASLF